jgi:hypothetical protein
MAKAQAEEMRVKRSDVQLTAPAEPSHAPGIEPLLHAGSKLLEDWMAVSSEILEFSRARIDRNLEVGKALARSTSIDEAMDLHADYARSLLRDYFAEASKLADLGTRAMLDTLWVWQPASRGETAPRHSAE